jgi:hypothetical protein
MRREHPGTKAVIFLVNHVNRASHLRSAGNGAMPLLQAMAASRSQHDPARVLALVGPTLGLASGINSPLALGRRHGARAERRLASPATGGAGQDAAHQNGRPSMPYPGGGALLFQTSWPSVPISAW